MATSRDRVVVIGAGIGGLSAALRLAHAGLDVTVVDSHSAPGGKMRTLPSPAGPVDAGPTVLTMRSVFDDLFAGVGETLEDHVTLLPEPLLARHFWPDGSSLDLFADAEESAAAIGAFAGSRAARQFRRFDRASARLFAAFEGPMMRNPAPSQGALTRVVLGDPGLLRAMSPLSSLAGQLRRSFSDPRLRQLFGRYATYVGGSPYGSPAILALIWQAEAKGVWRVAGGMHRLATAVAALAESRGARFRYGAHATRIELQSGRITAVHLAGGDRIPAARVIFNGDPRALEQGRLGAPAAAAVHHEAVEPRSLSAAVWAFAARPSGVELHHHNVFFGRDPRTEFDPIQAGMLPEDPTLYVCAEDRGTGMSPPETERFEIIMNAPPVHGPAKSEEYALCRTRTFPTLRDRGLSFAPEPPDAALTTPSRFDALFPASLGSLYGRSPHGLMAAFRRPQARTSVAGLYLAGGGAHPGAGVPMAALSGRHAAEAMLTDLASTSTSRPTATRGGTSTGSATTAAAPSR